MVAEGIVAAARAVRWYLPELVGPAAAEVDGALAAALNSPDATGADVAVRLEAVLSGHEETAAFLEAVLADAPHFRPPQEQPVLTRSPGYRPLPGESLPVPANRFQCPNGDFDWWRPSVGAPVPDCPTHRRSLVPG